MHLMSISSLRQVAWGQLSLPQRRYPIGKWKIGAATGCDVECQRSFIIGRRGLHLHGAVTRCTTLFQGDGTDEPIIISPAVLPVRLCQVLEPVLRVARVGDDITQPAMVTLSAVETSSKKVAHASLIV